MNLKRLVEISPIIGSFLIFIGFFKLYFFYNHWGINIISYLDFSEIILSFMNDLNILIFFFILLLIQMIIGVTTIFTIDKKMKKKGTENAIVIDSNLNNETIEQSIDSSQNIIDKFDDAIKKEFMAVFIGITFVTLLSLTLFLIFVKTIFLYLTFICFVQFILLITEKMELDSKSQIQTVFVLTLIGFTIGRSWFDIKQTESFPKIVSIQTDDSIYVTNNSLISLGKTNNFYFLYDRAKTQAVILPSSTIKKIKQTKQ